MDTHSQFLLVWYAILGAALAVMLIRYPTLLGKNTDIFSAVLSITLLGVSLSVTNRDFRNRAINMRKNYLELQNLYNTIKKRGSTTEKDIKKYANLLDGMDNHNSIDDKIFRVQNASSLESRKPTRIEYVQVFLSFIVKYFTLVFLYLAPLIVAWITYE